MQDVRNNQGKLICMVDSRTKTIEIALREKVAKEWSELNGVEITSEMINCEGCRSDGLKTPYCDSLCPIRQCALGKSVETCGDCTAMGCCQTIGMIISNNAEALNNLKPNKK